ncbi:MAG TPA: translation initiation factor IF-2 [Oligoflexia bacterium]|nr:translation initiation factor IF-2 [Oligoflexia bacterium]HMR25129.1 translation initiation factor IF-2 [Oligoflexia bacterium]
MDKENTEDKKALTEKRVTRRVIRRRKSTASSPQLEENQEKAEALVQEEQVTGVEASSEQTEQEAKQSVEQDEVEISESVKRKAASKAKVMPRGLKKVTKPKTSNVDSAVEADNSAVEQDNDTVDNTETTSDEKGGYSRIRVAQDIAKPEGGLRVVKPAPKDYNSNVVPTPGTGRRKDIIEIRDIYNPKNLRNKKRRKPAPGEGKKTEITVPRAAKRIIRMEDVISVAELAKKMSVKAGDVIGKLMGMGMMVTINQNIDSDTATLVANEFGYEVENVKVDAEDLLEQHEKALESKPEDLQFRPPVVTVMGHVDHGKTSLLDKIRKADVAAGEAGGITQHIGAYSVKLDSGKQVTFIDTPGHEAFTSMRARGARVTDIVILVVAGDDGVMPQTKEAINHAQSAEVPIIVAVNKVDKPGVDIDRIKNELTEFSMVPEEWGGDTIYVPVSAKTGQGINDLLEVVALQSDILELKANPDRPARGVVIEASLDKQKGVVSTLLVQDGTLREGDTIVAGTHYGRVRAMRDDKGMRVKEIPPSGAVELMGLSGVASAGDAFSIVPDEKKAKQITQLKHNQERQKELAKTSKVSLDDLYQKIALGDVKELKVVVKADTAGSVEVLTKKLEDLSTAKVSVKVIHGAVGGVSDNDVMLASASGAIVIAFHTRPTGSVRKLAEQESVDLRVYDIIYELLEDITSAMAGLLAPKEVETVLGHAQVRQIFTIPKQGTVAGCMVTDGKVLRSSKVRLIRENVPIYTGELSSLKRFKDDAKEVREGMECGMSIVNYNDIKVDDVIEAFEIEEVAAELE